MIKINRVDFKKMVYCCRNFDSFTHYIEDGRQMERAKVLNREYVDEFIKVAEKYGLEVKTLPTGCVNVGSATEIKLTDWLKEHDIEVEKRVWTEEEIKDIIQRSDKALYGALKRLYQEQTADEQRVGSTKYYNGVGFNGADSKFLSSVSEFLLKNEYLTDKQKATTRRKMIKYTKQLTRLANA